MYAKRRRLTWNRAMSQPRGCPKATSSDGTRRALSKPTLAGVACNPHEVGIYQMTHTQYPTVLDLPAAARLLGIGRTLAYELVRTGKWPTPVIRIGRLIKVPTQPVLELLGRSDLGPAA